MVVDDPRISRVSGEATVADTLPPFESDAYSSLHAGVATTLDPDDELTEPDDLGADTLSPDLLAAEPLIVESGDVEVIVADGPVLEGTVSGNVATIGWIAPTDADLLLE